MTASMTFSLRRRPQRGITHEAAGHGVASVPCGGRLPRPGGHRAFARPWDPMTGKRSTTPPGEAVSRVAAGHRAATQSALDAVRRQAHPRAPDRLPLSSSPIWLEHMPTGTGTQRRFHWDQRRMRGRNEPTEPADGRQERALGAGGWQTRCADRRLVATRSRSAVCLTCRSKRRKGAGEEPRRIGGETRRKPCQLRRTATARHPLGALRPGYVLRRQPLRHTQATRVSRGHARTGVWEGGERILH